jgi:hypothetical protein
MEALVAGAKELPTSTALPLDAPPAFLLDAARMPTTPDLRPGRFDNRWLVFPQDFPSANLLLARRIQSVWLVRETTGQPPQDLAHVLRRWQDAGLPIWTKGLRDNQPAALLQIERPKWYRAIYYRVLYALGLRRNSAGGFGSIIPMASAGG